MQSFNPEASFHPVDSGLRGLCGIAGFYRIPADPAYLARELALAGRSADEKDLLRAANVVGLRGRLLKVSDADRLATLPAPALVRLKSGLFAVFGGMVGVDRYRLVDPITRNDSFHTLQGLFELVDQHAIMIAQRRGVGITANAKFGFRWFLPSIWRYRKPLFHVLLATLFVQIFALATPLFFQVIVDKVLVHRGYETLLVLIAGLVIVGLFDAVLQYLRNFALTHTTSRIDVELGQRLFAHLLRLPLSYFESRSAGQTVARMRELETIRSFLTGQALFSAIDLAFAFVFVGVLFAYSWQLTLIVLISIPIYALLAVLVRPPLLKRINEKFNAGAESQQFLVEAVVGIHTIKSSAVEPLMRAQWEDRLASYVRAAFQAVNLGAGAQNSIAYVNRLTTALILLFGAKAVMEGDLTVGGLVAFNMIAGQVSQPVLRLSQLWQDFQQVQVSVERLGDILNAEPEKTMPGRTVLPPPRGDICFHNVRFRYRPGTPDVLSDLSFRVAPGEVVGIVGPSGSGKSTITRLIQRLYVPDEGQVLLDGTDLTQADPAWLRSHVGVVLQDNLLFNRSIHDNIAFANPALPRVQVIALARLAGADEFISRLPNGYDTMIEERGSNLSGGQRQRIAIARALATNPRILILDEATSALDYDSERIIQENMRHITRNRTCIIIAHRLAAVRQCDRIIGIQAGQIVEMGNHSELLTRQNGLYRRLWDIQNDQTHAA